MTEFTPYQLLTPLVCLFAVSYAWHLAFKQKKTLWEAILWTLFWGGIAAIAIFPRTMTYLATLTGIKNRENAVFITFFAILFFVIFYLVVRLEELEQRQTRLVRKMALYHSEKGKESEKKN